MKTTTLKFLKYLAVLFFFINTSAIFSQGNFYISYGGINITSGSTINVSSQLIEFSIVNIPGATNASITLNSTDWISLSNNNLELYQPIPAPIGFQNPDTDAQKIGNPVGYNIKKGNYFKFTLLKKNTTCGTFGTTVTIVMSNAQNVPTGNFTFTVNFTNLPAISVLGGTPTQTIPNGQTIPTSVNGTTFGTIDVGANSTRTYVITNTGTCPLTLNTLTLHEYVPGIGSTGVASTEFSIISLSTTTINPGSPAYLVVRFAPTSPGTKWGIISIPNSDLTKNPYTYVINAEGFNPTITGPGGLVADFRLWLKSTRGVYKTNNSSISTWYDLGSQGKDATAEVGQEPLFLDNPADNINFNPVVKFNNNGSSINQFMSNASNGFYSQEIFIVMLPDADIDITASPGIAVFSGKDDLSSTGNTGIGLGDYTTRISGEKLWFNQWNTTETDKYYALGSSTSSFTNQKIGLINAHNTDEIPANGMTLRYNAIDVGNLVPGTNTPFYNLGNLDPISMKIYGTPYWIGKSATATNGSFNGRIAEILTYAKNLLPNERPRVESYLAIKYGITLGINGTSQDYVNSGGVIVWNVAANSGFNYNIAGIARDVNSDLYQKQSKSANSTQEVTIGLGVIAATNSANPNEFNQDNDYLVWGSNNGSYTEDGSNTVTIKTGLTTSSTRINKKWKIVETGSDVGTVIVSIPEATLTGTFSKLATEEYTLIVADDASFSDASIIDIVPIKSDGNGNLTTWYDFDGTNYFTFGKAPKLEGVNLVNIAAGDYLVGEYGLNLNSGSFTVVCWIRNDGSSATNRTIIGKGPDLILRLNSNHKIEALWDGNSNLISNTSINDGKWHHITAVYSGGSAFLYIDGILDKTVYSILNPKPNYYRFSVGATYLSKSNIVDPFRGEIDELQIWDQVLSYNQINYLMNQEIEKYGDATVNGKIIPQTITKNEIKTIQWTTLKAYYDFNSFYGTTVEGLTNDRNFLRIKYLNKTKTIVNTQTAPLPYETIADGTWSDEAVWKNGSIQQIPNDYSIVTVGSETVDGNIVKIYHNLTSIGNKTLLGLYIDGVNTSDYKTLSAQEDSKVEVSHYLKLDGLIDLQGKSQLVQTLNSELDATSKGFIKRSQEGTGNKFNYNYWSSPVGPINATTNNNNYTLSEVFKSGTTTSNQSINWISGYNGAVGPPISLARYWLWKFENGNEYANWVQFNENGALRPSQGFTLKGNGAVGSTQNYTFVGKPFNGPISSNSVLANNLYLVGNPYPSAIDAQQFIIDNIDVIEGTIYIWEHSPTNNTHNLGGYTGGYSTITLTGGTGPIAPAGIKGLGVSAKIPKQYIPIGQAFFVGGKSDLSGATPIIFNNGQRFFVKEDAVDDFGVAISNTLIRNTGKTSKTTLINRFEDNTNYPIYNDYYTKIRLGVIAPNDNYRELLIGFLDYEATDGIDKGYDGMQIDTQTNDAYFIINNKNYSIQGVGRFNQTKKYPIGIKTAIAGVTKIKIDAIEFLNADQKIYIHDKETNIYHEITKQSVDLNLPVGVYNDRFVLTFNDGTFPEYGFEEIGIHESLLISSANNIEEEFNLSDNSLNVYMNNSEIKIHIQKTSGVEIKNLEIYNMLGQLIFTVNKFNNSNSLTLDFPTNTSAGIYLVKVFTNEGIHAKKILKN